MKLSKIFLSTAIALSSVCAFNQTAIAGQSVFIEVPGKTSEGDKLYLDALSIDKVENIKLDESERRGSNLRTFQYMIVSNGSVTRFKRAGVYCTRPGYFYVLQDDWSDKKILATSEATKTMLYAVCGKTL